MARNKGRDLRRARPSREPKRKYTLFCEGMNTEPAYFRALGRSLANSLIVIETVPGVGVPMTIAKQAVEYATENGLRPRSRKKKDSFEEGDEVWAVFDRDDHPLYREAIQNCESSNVGVAYSNPCFELWLILHEVDFDAPDGRRDLQKRFGLLRPEYDPDAGKTPDCDDLVTRVAIAEERAERQLARRVEEGNASGPPSTTVGTLTRRIRTFSEDA